MSKFADIVDQFLETTIDVVLSEAEGKPPDVEYIETDSLGEVVEKLAILHIRTWMLEDAIQAAESDEEIAALKRKIDICFKVKRPKYVQAINAMVENSIRTGKSLREDSVKLYKGVDNAQ
jgi:hypothetical protein